MQAGTMGVSITMSDKHYKAVRKETRRFLMAGAVATFVDYLIFNILVTFLHLPIFFGNVISTSSGSIISFLLNRKVVFDGQRHESTRKSLLLYALIIGTGIYVIQSLVLYIVHITFPEFGKGVYELLQAVGIDTISERAVQTNAAKVCASIVSAIWNFTMLRHFVFVPLTHDPDKHVN